MTEDRSRPLTKEDFLARAAAVQEQLRRQNPDQPDVDLKLSSGWWKPVVQFSGVLHESIPQDVNDKLAAASREFAAASFSRDALDKFAGECRALLAGHEDALRLFEDTIMKKPEVWDQFHEHAVANKGKEGGLIALETCGIPGKLDPEL